MPEDEKHQSGNEKKHGLRLGGVSVWTALIGTVLAIMGTVIAYEQVRLANVEKSATEQQSLVAVVSDIAHLTQAEPTAPSDQVAPIHEASDADAAVKDDLKDAQHAVRRCLQRLPIPQIRPGVPVS